jgi:hypothetical protein
MRQFLSIHIGHAPVDHNNSTLKNAFLKATPTSTGKAKSNNNNNKKKKMLISTE